MKTLRLALMAVLLLAIAAGQAAAYDIFFIMGDPSDNVTQLEVVVDKAHCLDHKMTMKPVTTDTGPGYQLILVKTDDGDPCNQLKQAPAPQGNGKMLHMPGSEDLRNIIVQLSDQNHYNQTHTLSFNWLDDCHRLAYVTVDSK